MQTYPGTSREVNCAKDFSFFLCLFKQMCDFGGETCDHVLSTAGERSFEAAASRSELTPVKKLDLINIHHEGSLRSPQLS